MKISRVLCLVLTVIMLLVFGAPTIYAEESELVAPKAVKAPKIDGVLDKGEWGNILLNIKEGAPNTNASEGFNDENFTADVYTQWDDKNLYVCAVVTDEEHTNDMPKEQMYMADCMQINIMPVWPDMNKEDGWNELGFMASTDFSRVEGFRWFGLGSPEFNPQPYDDADVAIKRVGKNTIYEIAIPWKSVTPEGTVYKEGDKIGYAVAFTIPDEIGGQSIGIEYAGSLFSKDPFTAATLVLGPALSASEPAADDSASESTNSSIIIAIVVVVAAIIIGAAAYIIKKKKTASL